ncbi:MAG: hypothetical protein HPY74_19030 [Firmicutes bacterium]|nr:hypothetical protein [Bacillota bacterium]
MKNDNEKKGLFDRLTGSRKAKKSSCCCNFEIEELPDENTNSKTQKTPEKEKGNSCCR